MRKLSATSLQHLSMNFVTTLMTSHNTADHHFMRTLSTRSLTVHAIINAVFCCTTLQVVTEQVRDLLAERCIC
jgi:hypothetical protein